MIDDILTEAGYKYDGMSGETHIYTLLDDTGIRITLEIPDSCMHLPMQLKLPVQHEVPVNSKDRQNQDYTDEQFRRDAAAMQRRMDRAQAKSDKKIEDEKKQDDADANRLFEQANAATSVVVKTKPLSKRQQQKAVRALRKQLNQAAANRH